MDTLFVILKNVIVFVLLAVPGYILVKTRKATAETGAVLSKILVSIAMPFLILSSVAKIRFDSSSLGILGISALIGIAYHFLWIRLCRFLSKDGVSRFSMIFSNNGFLGLPLAVAIFGSDSLIVTSIIVVNILTNILMQTEGLAIIAEEKKKFSWKILLNPLLISFVLGCIINLAGIFQGVPEALSYCTYLSNLVTPLSMLIIGIQLGNADLKKLFSVKQVYTVSVVKLIAVPAVISAILLLLGMFMSVPKDLVIGMFIAFAMPTAGLAPVYAGMCKKDTELAVFETIGTTVFSVITIPALYFLLDLLI